MTRWLIHHAPRIVVTDTHQVMLAVAMVGMGVAFLLGVAFDQAGLIARPLPSIILRVIWAASFLFGGILQIFALQRCDRATERLGMALTALGSLAYSLTLMGSLTAPAVAIAIVFLFFVVAYVTRILVSDVAAADRRAYNEGN